MADNTESSESKNSGINITSNIDVVKGLPPFTSDIKKDDNADHFFLVASSCRGKSFILKEMYEKLYKKDTKLIIILISPSMDIALFKKIKGPNVIKINKFSKQTVLLIQQIIKIQQETNNDYRFLIMIDDVTDQYHNSVLNNLFLVNRNQQISTILSCQYPLILSKRARSSVKHLITGGLNSDESIETILNSYLKSHMTTECKKDMPNPKKIDLVDKYREITDGNDGHTFIWYSPQHQTVQPFTL